MSETQLQVQDKGELITKEKVAEYLTAFGLATGLSVDEKSQFTEVAVAFGLNPFKREIYCVPYGKGESRKLSIITGYETYLKRAERTQKLDGWRAWAEGSTKDKATMKACIEIYRKDRSRPFVHEVKFLEYAQDNSMWRNKPETMLKKVVMAQGFRLCFPDELGGMPYTSDELPDNMTGLKPVNDPPPAAAEKDAPAGDQGKDQMEKDFDMTAEADAKAKAETAKVELEEYRDYRKGVLEAVLGIVGKKGAAGSWTKEEIDFIEGSKLPTIGVQEHDRKPLAVLLLRAKAGKLAKESGQWETAMPHVISAGMDEDSLTQVVKAMEAVVADMEEAINVKFDSVINKELKGLKGDM